MRSKTSRRNWGWMAGWPKAPDLHRTELSGEPECGRKGGAMAEFPYCTNSSSVRRCFEVIQNTAVPRRMSAQFLAGLDFRGSDVRSLTNILKSLGFVTASDVPTKRWRSYREKTAAPHVMAQAVRELYADFFEMYPDAYRKEEDALSAFFNSQTNVAPSTLKYMMRTFRTLCGLADFEGAPALENPMVPAARPESVLLPPVAEPDPPARDVSLNVTVQLQLPATNDPAVYDALFAALRRHLLD